jgi:hypothetical protein
MSELNLSLTPAGQGLMAKINAGGGTVPLEITRIVTSSDATGDPMNMTVGDVVIAQTFVITGRTVSGARATISAYLNNFGNPTASPPIPPLANGYTLSRIWFFANDPDDGEIPLRVSQFENPNYVPAATERAWEYEHAFNFVTGNASTVIIEINPASNVTKQDVWNSVEISDANIPNNYGVRTHYRIFAPSPNYKPVNPDPDDPDPGDDSVDGILWVDGMGAVNGFIEKENGDIEPMVLQI